MPVENDEHRRGCSVFYRTVMYRLASCSLEHRSSCLNTEGGIRNKKVTEKALHEPLKHLLGSVCLVGFLYVNSHHFLVINSTNRA